MRCCLNHHIISIGYSIGFLICTLLSEMSPAHCVKCNSVFVKESSFRWHPPLLLINTCWNYWHEWTKWYFMWSYLTQNVSFTLAVSVHSHTRKFPILMHFISHSSLHLVLCCLYPDCLSFFVIVTKNQVAPITSNTDANLP